MEHSNAGLNAPEVAAGTIQSAAQLAASNPAGEGNTAVTFGGWNPVLQWSSNNNLSSLFGSPASGSLPAASTLFGAPPPSPPEAVGDGSGSNANNDQPPGIFQFPSFGQKSTHSTSLSAPTSEPWVKEEGNPTAPVLFGAQGSSSPSSGVPGFRIFATSRDSTGASSGLFQFPSLVAPQTAPPIFGCNPSFGASAQAFGCSTAAASGSAPAFGCSSGATRSPGFGCSTGLTSGPALPFGCSSATARSPAFGCSYPSNSLFSTPIPSTPSWTSGPFSFCINGSVVPSGFSCPANGFNQLGQWLVPSCTQPWPNTLPLDAKRCYCGKVAGVRFSNEDRRPPRTVPLLPRLQRGGDSERHTRPQLLHLERMVSLLAQSHSSHFPCLPRIRMGMVLLIISFFCNPCCFMASMQVQQLHHGEEVLLRQDRSAAEVGEVRHMWQAVLQLPRVQGE